MEMDRKNSVILEKSQGRVTTIKKAIISILNSFAEGRATLRQIYECLFRSFPEQFSAEKANTWKNSVRHCLSTNACFRCVSMPSQDIKGRPLVSYWIYNDELRASRAKYSEIFSEIKLSRITTPTTHTDHTTTIRLPTVLRDYGIRKQQKTIPNPLPLPQPISPPLSSLCPTSVVIPPELHFGAKEVYNSPTPSPTQSTASPTAPVPLRLIHQPFEQEQVKTRKQMDFASKEILVRLMLNLPSSTVYEIFQAVLDRMSDR